MAPEDKKVYKYTGSECTAEQLDLDSLLPGATVEKTNSPRTVALTVPALPEKETQFCYVCNYTNPASKTKAWKPCTVVVTVAAKEPPSGTATSTQAPTTSAEAATAVCSAGALAVAVSTSLALK